MSSRIFIGAVRRITLTYFVPGTPEAQTHTFYPEQVNVVTAELFQHLVNSSKPGSPRKGGIQVNPITEYIETKMLWDIPPGEARTMLDSGLAPAAPDPRAGIKIQAARMPDVPQSAAARELADRMAQVS